jgi:hypothetical protein
MIDKGFKPVLQMSPKDAIALEKLCDAVIADEPDSGDHFAAWTRRFVCRIGGKRTWAHWIVHKAVEELHPDLLEKLHRTILLLMSPPLQRELLNRTHSTH